MPVSERLRGRPCLEVRATAPPGVDEVGLGSLDRAQQLEALESGSLLHRTGAAGEALLEHLATDLRTVRTLTATKVMSRFCPQPRPRPSPSLPSSCRSRPARSRVLLSSCRQGAGGAGRRAAEPGLRCDGPRDRGQAGCPCGLSGSTTTAQRDSDDEDQANHDLHGQSVLRSDAGTRRSQPTDRCACQTPARMPGATPHHVLQAPSPAATAPTCQRMPLWPHRPSRQGMLIAAGFTGRRA